MTDPTIIISPAGDDSISDMGLEFNLSSVRFCEEYQITITKYRTI